MVFMWLWGRVDAHGKRFSGEWFGCGGGLCRLYRVGSGCGMPQVPGPGCQIR